MNRRDCLRLGTVAVWSGVVGNGFWAAPSQAAELSPTSASNLPLPNPDQALQRLMEGNQRFVQHQPTYPDQSQARVTQVSQAQHPFVTLLSCADSRVPAEIVFDQGIGDVFDVRIAGNIVTPESLGSLEYAVALLNTPLLMVLGHERCGAVTAAVQNKALPGDIGTFVKAVLPAVEQVKDQPGDLVNNAVTSNILYQIQQLQRSTLLTNRLQTGTLKIVGGRYDLDTGLVTLVA